MLAMNLGKGLGYSAIGALIGAMIWVTLVSMTGMRLWVLAPIVGGAAGYGMMRATQMKGGFAGGAIAAALTLAAIFGVRYFVVSQEVRKQTAVTEEGAFEHFTDAVAADMAQRGMTTHDEEGEYLAKVHYRAREAWTSMTWEEHEQYLAARWEENRAAAGVLTPLGLLFDFGIFGTICAALAAGTAFKTGSIRLEDAVVEKGLAAGGEDAAAVAAKMRAADARGRGRVAPSSDDSPPAGRWGIPTKAPEERPIKKIKIVSTDEGEAPPKRDEAA